MELDDIDMGLSCSQMQLLRYKANHFLVIEELFHFHRLVNEINQEVNILSDFQRSPACSAPPIMVRRVSCGLQLATVPELQVDYNDDGNLDDGYNDDGSVPEL